jgi:hypothetical protein
MGKNERKKIYYLRKYSTMKRWEIKNVGDRY